MPKLLKQADQEIHGLANHLFLGQHHGQHSRGQDWVLADAVDHQSQGVRLAAATRPHQDVVLMTFFANLVPDGRDQLVEQGLPVLAHGQLGQRGWVDVRRCVDQNVHARCLPCPVDRVLASCANSMESWSVCQRHQENEPDIAILSGDT